MKDRSEIPESTVSFDEILKEKVDSSKILFTGLDGAGKTSIILALQREFAQIATLKPTLSAQRRVFDYLGRKIAEWDLGGQKRYRISYLKSPGRYFDKTSACIYVIDINDTKRLEESLSYLNDVIKQFAILGITPPLYIFLHKYDPDLREKEPVETAKKIAEIRRRTSEIIMDRHRTEYFKTSIYDLWSIMSAFSKILLDLFPKSDLLDKTVSEFAAKIGADGILLLDEQSLIISEYYADEKEAKTLQASTPYFLTLDDSFTGGTAEDETENNKMILMRGNKGFYFKKFPPRKNLEALYLLIMKDDINFVDEEIDTFMKVIYNILVPD